MIINERFSKLTRQITTVEVIPMQIASTFLHSSVIPYRITSYVLTDNEPQSVSKFFTALFLFFGVKKLTATAYHMQRNGQIEQYN